MALYFIGLGLWDEKDISLRGLETVRNCDKVYIETYTSKLNCSIKDLEKLYCKELIEANREFVESKDEIVNEAKNKDVAFLVVGDPFGATTHTDLRLRALEEGVRVRVVHNASIINAIGSTGLDLYKFGRTTSIPFENKNITSPISVINNNREAGLSTLVLFDLDMENDLFMKVSEALEFLLGIGLEKDTLCVGCAGVGSPEPEIFAGKAEVLKKKEFTLEPQCLIIPGKTHPMEDEMIKRLKTD
ncbi:MAG: diphthine synthase [Nanoarchaeota archaeon]